MAILEGGHIAPPAHPCHYGPAPLGLTQINVNFSVSQFRNPVPPNAFGFWMVSIVRLITFFVFQELNLK